MVYLCLNTLSPFYQGLTQHIMQNKLLAFNPSDPPHLTPVAHHIFSHLLCSCTSTLLTRGNCAWKTKTAKAQPFYQGELARGSTLLSRGAKNSTLLSRGAVSQEGIHSITKCLVPGKPAVPVASGCNHIDPDTFPWALLNDAHLVLKDDVMALPKHPVSLATFPLPFSGEVDGVKGEVQLPGKSPHILPPVVATEAEEMHSVIFSLQPEECILVFIRDIVFNKQCPIPIHNHITLWLVTVWVFFQLPLQVASIFPFPCPFIKGTASVPFTKGAAASLCFLWRCCAAWALWAVTVFTAGAVLFYNFFANFAVFVLVWQFPFNKGCRFSFWLSWCCCLLFAVAAASVPVSTFHRLVTAVCFIFFLLCRTGAKCKALLLHLYLFLFWWILHWLLLPFGLLLLVPPGGHLIFPRPLAFSFLLCLLFLCLLLCHFSNGIPFKLWLFVPLHHGPLFTFLFELLLPWSAASACSCGPSFVVPWHPFYQGDKMPSPFNKGRMKTLLAWAKLNALLTRAAIPSRIDALNSCRWRGCQTCAWDLGPGCGWCCGKPYRKNSACITVMAPADDVDLQFHGLLTWNLKLTHKK